MTPNDYDRIANVFANRLRIDREIGTTGDVFNTQAAARDMAIMFAYYDPQFDLAQFLTTTTTTGA